MPMKRSVNSFCRMEWVRSVHLTLHSSHRNPRPYFKTVVNSEITFLQHLIRLAVPKHCGINLAMLLLL